MSKKFSNVNLNSLAARGPASNPSQRATARSLNPARGLVSLGPSKPATVKKPTTAWGQPKEDPEPPEENVQSYRSDASGCIDRPTEEVPETPEVSVDTVKKTSSLSWADASEVWEDRDEWLLQTKSLAKQGQATAIQEEGDYEPSAESGADVAKNWGRNASPSTGAHSSSQPQVQVQQRPQDLEYRHLRTVPPPPSSVPPSLPPPSLPPSLPPPSLPPPALPGSYQLQQDPTQAGGSGDEPKADKKKWKTTEVKLEKALPHRSPQNQRLQLEYQRHLDQTRGTIPKGGSIEGTPREFEVQDVPSTALVMNLSSVLKRLHGSCSMQQLIKALPSLKEQGVCIESFLHSHAHVFELKGRIVYLKTPEEAWDAPRNEQTWQEADWQENWRDWKGEPSDWKDEPSDWNAQREWDSRPSGPVPKGEKHAVKGDAKGERAPKGDTAKGERAPKGDAAPKGERHIVNGDTAKGDDAHPKSHPTRNERRNDRSHQDGRRKRNAPVAVIKHPVEDDDNPNPGAVGDRSAHPSRRRDRVNRQPAAEKDANASSQRGKKNAQGEAPPQDASKKKPSPSDESWRQPAGESSQPTRSQRSRRNKKSNANDWADWSGWNENGWWENSGNQKKR